MNARVAAGRMGCREKRPTAFRRACIILLAILRDDKPRGKLQLERGEKLVESIVPVISRQSLILWVKRDHEAFAREAGTRHVFPLSLGPSTSVRPCRRRQSTP